MIYPTKKLVEVCDILIGGTPRRGVDKYWKNGSLPWVSIADLTRSGHIITNTKEKITKMGAEESGAKLIPKGSLIFSFKLSIGKMAFTGVDLYTNEAIAAFIIKNDEKLDKKFLYYFLQQEVFETAHKAVKGKTLNKNKLKNLEIPLPPLETQKKIVAKLESLLAKASKAKKHRAKAQQSTQNLLPAALHKIFEEGKKKGWGKKELGEVCKVVGGGTPSTTLSEYWDGDIVWVTPKDLGKLQNYQIKDSGRKITKKGLENSSAKLLPIGTVILSSRAPIGYVAIAGTPLATNQGCRNFICGDAINNKYLYYFLGYSTTLLNSKGSGSTFSEISGSKLKKIKIPLPPIDEQEKIVKYLDALSEKSKQVQTLQSQTAEDFQELEQSILHKAFAGELVE